jgi:hypothetical protein
LVSPHKYPKGRKAFFGIPPSSEIFPHGPLTIFFFLVLSPSFPLLPPPLPLRSFF